MSFNERADVKKPVVGALLVFFKGSPKKGPLFYCVMLFVRAVVLALDKGK